MINGEGELVSSAGAKGGLLEWWAGLGGFVGGDREALGRAKLFPGLGHGLGILRGAFRAGISLVGFL